MLIIKNCIILNILLVKNIILEEIKERGMKIMFHYAVKDYKL